jgi:hypothetical protein
VAPDLLVQPLICYESLFPRLAKPVPGVRAIVNVSNDAWFGVTSGPLQHLNLASYRAIETGLPDHPGDPDRRLGPDRRAGTNFARRPLETWRIRGDRR